MQLQYIVIQFQAAMSLHSSSYGGLANLAPQGAHTYQGGPPWKCGHLRSTFPPMSFDVNTIYVFFSSSKENPTNCRKITHNTPVIPLQYICRENSNNFPPQSKSAPNNLCKPRTPPPLFYWGGGGGAMTGFRLFFFYVCAPFATSLPSMFSFDDFYQKYIKIIFF